MKSWMIGCTVAAMSLPTVASAQGYDPRGNAGQMSRESYSNQAGQNSRLGIPPDQDTKSSIQLYGDLIDHGRCTAKVSKRRVHDALDAVAASANEQSLFRDIAAQSQACRSRFNAVMALNRGVLAEGMYHQETGKALSYGPLQPADSGFKAFLAREASHNANLDGNDRAMTSAAACLVAQQPLLTDQILATEHGTPQEAQAMDALFVTAPTCAGPTRPARLSRAYLRAYVALAAYRFQQFRMPAKS